MRLHVQLLHGLRRMSQMSGLSLVFGVSLGRQSTMLADVQGWDCALRLGCGEARKVLCVRLLQHPPQERQKLQQHRGCQRQGKQETNDCNRKMDMPDRSSRSALTCARYGTQHDVQCPKPLLDDSSIAAT